MRVANNNRIFAHNKALHLTAIPLRSIAAGELDRYAEKRNDMTISPEQQIQQLVSTIKGRRAILDSTAKRLRTPEIIDAFDKDNYNSWCLSVVGDALVRLRLFTEQNFNFIETMGIVAVARYVFELSVWLNLFKMDRRYGLVYYAQLLETQLRYWKDYRAQLDREIALLHHFEAKEHDAQKEAMNQIKATSDPEIQKQMARNLGTTVPNMIDREAGRHFSIFVEQAKVNGYGFQAHLLKEKLIPQIDQSIEGIISEKTAFGERAPQAVKALMPGKWQWKQMAQKVGLTDEHDYVYSYCSKLLHATPASITTDQKNLELAELVVFLKYIDVKILDMLEIANEYLWGSA